MVGLIAIHRVIDKVLVGTSTDWVPTQGSIVTERWLRFNITEVETNISQIKMFVSVDTE